MGEGRSRRNHHARGIDPELFQTYPERIRLGCPRAIGPIGCSRRLSPPQIAGQDAHKKALIFVGEKRFMHRRSKTPKRPFFCGGSRIEHFLPKVFYFRKIYLYNMYFSPCQGYLTIYLQKMAKISKIMLHFSKIEKKSRKVRRQGPSRGSPWFWKRKTACAYRELYQRRIP